MPANTPCLAVPLRRQLGGISPRLPYARTQLYCSARKHEMHHSRQRQRPTFSSRVSGHFGSGSIRHTPRLLSPPCAKPHTASEGQAVEHRSSTENAALAPRSRPEGATHIGRENHCARGFSHGGMRFRLQHKTCSDRREREAVALRQTGHNAASHFGLEAAGSCKYMFW